MSLLFRISGCGISAICESGEPMLWWIQQIVNKGGVPKIEPYYPELERAA